MKKLISLTIGITFVLNFSLYAQEIKESEANNQPIYLKGTHSVSLHAGFQDFQSKLAYTAGGVTASSNFVGYLSYQYWMNDNSALSFSLGILESETIARFSDTYSKATIPIVIGYDFYPDGFRWGNMGRGYFGMNFGTYIERTSGVSTNSDHVAAGTDAKIKPGGDLHVGVDFFPATYLRVGPQVAFHSTEHFQGVAFSLTFGVLL